MKATLFSAPLTFISFAIASAEPSIGHLTRQSKDFLKYECSVGENGLRQCDFVQVLLTRNLQPEEIEDRVMEGLAEAMQEFTGPRLDDVCQSLMSIAPIFELLARGDVEQAKNQAMSLSGDISAEFLDSEGLDAMSQEELSALAEQMQSFVAVCDEPSRENVEMLLRREAESEADTCRMTINEWSSTFRQLNNETWTIVQDGAQGSCGIVRLDRFICDADYPSLCEFVSEKRILAPNAEGFIPCSELDETPQLYGWGRTGSFLKCSIVDF